MDDHGRAMRFLQAASKLDAAAIEHAGVCACYGGVRRVANPYRERRVAKGALARPAQGRPEAQLETCLWWLGWDKAALRIDR
jgi:hypothetical protein